MGNFVGIFIMIFIGVMLLIMKGLFVVLFVVVGVLCVVGVLLYLFVVGKVELLLLLCCGGSGWNVELNVV